MKRKKQIAAAFASRMAADQCGLQMTYVTNAVTDTITGVVVSSTGNTCSVPLPVTFPGTVTSTHGFTTEQIGNDPLTIWVEMTGSPVTFTLSTPVPW